jgi:galactokinase
MRAGPDDGIARAAMVGRMDAAELVDRLLALDGGPAIDRAQVRVVHAPGRVNLIGEHTDYNSGFVLPVAIDRGISIAFVPTFERRASLMLVADGRAAQVELDEPRPPDGTWVDYVAGVAWALREAGGAVSGFRGVLAADLPAGAGLSSSAAIELVVAWALGGGAPPLDDRLDLARTAQRAENEYVGVACGLMDQFAVTFGEPDRAMLLDCRSLQHRPIPIPPGVALVVCDSGVPRRLAGSGYGDRRAECARAVEQIRSVAPEVTSLRDVDADLLATVREALDPVAFRRARHVVTENARVLAAAAALEEARLLELGVLLAASHESLRDDFEASTPEVDRLVAWAQVAPGAIGARLTGGGFGGSVVALVANDGVEAFADHLRRGYRTPAGSSPAVLRVAPAAGAGLIAGPGM